MKELRKIDFNEKKFTCDGREFTVTDTLSFARYREFIKIKLEFGYSCSFAELWNNLSAIPELFNKGKYFEMANLNYKMLEGIKNATEKDVPALRICALFINEKGEDPTIYSESLMKDKIDCWGRELEISPFFYLAAGLVENWKDAYESIILNGLTEPVEKKRK